jgi:hypothetical protein
MRRVVLLVLATAVIGCANNEPGRLAVGQRCIAVKSQQLDRPVVVPDGVENLPILERVNAFKYLDIGDSVQVLLDDSKHLDPTRQIMVVILSGKHRGEKGRIGRDQLIPESIHHE